MGMSYLSGSMYNLNRTERRFFLLKIILLAGLTTAGSLPTSAQHWHQDSASGKTLTCSPSYSRVQRDSVNALAESVLSERGEVYIRFPQQSLRRTDMLPRSFSIDKVEDGHVYTYAGRRHFREFLDMGISYELLMPPSSRLYLLNGPLHFDPATYDSYPSYGEYVNRMLDMADSFPGICHIDTIGVSINNHLILAAGISGSGSFGKGKPIFLYTSTIHGDETTGYMLLLRLTDYLLHEYGKDSLVTRLADRIEIWINPLANPDGTYAWGDAGVFLSNRLNANGMDLNRNFPDPADGDHPDGEEWQPETIAMMEFMKQHPPDMSANLHSGAEVVNYPWDTWWVLHADEDWFRMISKNYADTVRSNSMDYFLQFEEGITRGIDWYRISGGRQDYVTYFLHGREVTLELSIEKVPSPDELAAFWEYNRKALLQLMEQCLFGIRGKTVDSESGQPVMAKITMPDHDKDNSYVYSDSLTGTFYRFLKEGIYAIRAEAPGYQARTVEQVQVLDGKSTSLDILMDPVKTGLARQYKQPDLTVAGTRIIYYLEQAGTATLNVFDLAGKQMLPALYLHSSAGRNETDVGGRLSGGIYLIMITCHGQSFSYICSFNF